jgi:hypothetical protein
MKRISCFKSITLFLFLVPTFSEGQEVVLFGNPIEGEAVVYRLPKEAPAFNASEPALDPAAAAEGWRAVEVSGPFRGFVMQSDLDKTGAVPPGAPILSEPSEDAHILTFAEKGDSIDITSKGDWTEVTFSKPLMLYFKEEKQETAGQMEETGGEPGESGAPSSVAPVVIAPVATETRASTATATPEPEEEPVIVLPPTEVLPPERVTPPPAREIAEIFEGTFRPSGSRLRLLPAPYPYELVASDGSRIAYLDLSKTLLQGLPQDYFNSQVAVYGMLTEDGNPRRLVIRVHQMR